MKWENWKPSQLTCERCVFFRITQPENGNPLSWRDIGWLGQIGQALHEYFVPKVAKLLEEEGWDVQVEVPVTATLFGVTWDARIDLLAKKDDKVVVYDFKFVSPSVVSTANYPSHRRQIAIYAALVQASHAVLYYVDRTNPTRYSTVIFTDEDIVQILQEEVFPFVTTVKNALQNSDRYDEILPRYRADSYPCKFVTREGTALCYFYHICHPNSTARNELIATAGDPTVASRLEELINNYIKVTHIIDEVEQELQPYREQQKLLRAQLIELLPPDRTYETHYGTIQIKRIIQHRLDTTLAKSLLEAHNIVPPMKAVEVTQIIVNKAGEK